MPRPLSASIATLLLTAAAAFAQSSPDDALAPSFLDEMIVTASREEETLFETPYTAHVIPSKRFLGERAARTLPDALR